MHLTTLSKLIFLNIKYFFTWQKWNVIYKHPVKNNIPPIMKPTISVVSLVN